MSKPMKAKGLRGEAEPNVTDETALVLLARDGDSHAFCALVKIHQRRAVSVAYRLLGNIEDASDVSQDAFVRAFKSLSQLEDPAKFGGWLMRVVTNLSLNFRRSRATRRAVSLDDVASSGGEFRDRFTGRRAAVELEGEGGAGSMELDAAINDALDTLPDKQRLALILFSVEGMAQKEVAEILECSIELVKWNVFQARRKLKDLLGSFL